MTAGYAMLAMIKNTPPQRAQVMQRTHFAVRGNPDAFDVAPDLVSLRLDGKACVKAGCGPTSST